MLPIGIPYFSGNSDLSIAINLNYNWTCFKEIHEFEPKGIAKEVLDINFKLHLVTVCWPSLKFYDVILTLG